MSRIESIRKLLQASPDDVFLLYSLGMELLSEGSSSDAIEQFQRVIDLEGDYLAAYSQLGQAMQAAGDIAGARGIFSQGIDVADRQGDRHSRDRLELLLGSLGDDI